MEFLLRAINGVNESLLFSVCSIVGTRDHVI